MASTVGNIQGGGARILDGAAIINSNSHLPLRRHLLLFPPIPSPPPLSLSGRVSHIASAKRFSSRTGRLDGKNQRGFTTTKEEEEEERTDGIERGTEDSVTGAADGAIDDAGDGYFLPELPGNEPDFWEGPQWDGLGFFVQYMWAFGIAFALIACGVAVATYNEGATDFKQTPAYKESIQSQELLEEPEESNSDVFESNPTEAAPSLD